MNKAIIAFLIALCLNCPLASAERLEDVFVESRNTLTCAACDVQWEQVVTDEVLIQGVFELRNDTDSVQIIRRVVMVVGTSYDLDDVCALDGFSRGTFMYQRRMADPELPEYDKEFWAPPEIEDKLISVEIAPGESVTSRFACILPRKRSIENVQVLLLDLCDEKKEKP